MTTAAHLWDNTVVKANTWLAAVATELRSEDPQEALAAFRAVSHALRDRLQVNEAAQLAAQMPLLIKGVYFDGWNPSKTPIKVRSKEDFLALVARSLRGTALESTPERVTRAVCRVLAARISDGEIGDVRGVLPHDLADLWPEGAGHGTPA